MTDPRHERSRPGTTRNGFSAQKVTPTSNGAQITAAIAVLARALSPAQWRTIAAYIETGGRVG